MSGFNWADDVRQKKGNNENEQKQMLRNLLLYQANDKFELK